MKGLSITEADNLFPVEGVDAWIKRLRRVLPLYGNAFSVEARASRRTALARFLGSSLCCNESGCVVYITQCGIFPASEHLDLFDTYRLGAGETRAVNDAPLQSFSPEEGAALISILCLILYFSWDAEIASLDERWLVTISHDNWMEIRTADTPLIETRDAEQSGILVPLGSA